MLQAIERDIHLAFEGIEADGPPPHHDRGSRLRAMVSAYVDGERAMWTLSPLTDLNGALEYAVMIVRVLGADNVLLVWAETTERYEMDEDPAWPFPPCKGDRYDALFAAWYGRDGAWGYKYRPFALGEDEKGIWADPLDPPIPSEWAHGLIGLTATRFKIEYRKPRPAEELIEGIPLEMRVAATTVTLRAVGAHVSVGDDTPFDHLGKSES